MNAEQLIKHLHATPVTSWFEFNLLLDQIRDQRPVPIKPVQGNLAQFIKRQKRIAFFTYGLGVDGVTIEVEKYTDVLQRINPKLEVHYVAGKVNPAFTAQAKDNGKIHELSGLAGFEHWPHYNTFFRRKLKRGGKYYNELILDFWGNIKQLTAALAKLVEHEQLDVLIPINVTSNPGNIAFTAALVLVSEYLGIPVIANHHDFYWEGGHSKTSIKLGNAKKGPRDLFFTNAEVGELFSVIETLFPWDSPRWLYVNINTDQSQHLVEQNGLNPLRVTDIGTAVDERLLEVPQPQQKTISLLLLQGLLGKVVLPDAKLLQGQPIVFGNERKSKIHLADNCLFFLQPTRIIERKHIELNFDMLLALCNQSAFNRYLDQNPKLQILIVITGPVAVGHEDYAKTLVNLFKDLLKALPAKMRDRVFLGMLFGILPTHAANPNDLTVYDLYRAAAFITLPSETEGRGLPIIEAAALRTPIITRRYEPESVYAHVIGEHLSSEQRLRVIEFKQSPATEPVIQKIVDHILQPLQYMGDVEHNVAVVEERYSMESLQQNWEDIWKKLYAAHQTTQRAQVIAGKLLSSYKQFAHKPNVLARRWIGTARRQPLAGYGKLAYMLYLKSLIDPSHFRVEEQQVRGYIFNYALQLVAAQQTKQPIQPEAIYSFYAIVAELFTRQIGKLPIRADHSLAYRHRSVINFAYQQFTVQELTGAVHLAFEQICKPQPTHATRSGWITNTSNLGQQIIALTESSDLPINHSERLAGLLAKNIPIALFLGDRPYDELDVFALAVIQKRLGIPFSKLVPISWLKRSKASPVYLFIPKQFVGMGATTQTLNDYLNQPEHAELKRYVSAGLCIIVPTTQRARGVHWNQLGGRALSILQTIRRNNGIVITNGDAASMTTDICAVDMYHIGKVKHPLTAEIMGIPVGSGFVEWVPAGIRPTLTYPTPIQRSIELSQTLLLSQLTKAERNQLPSLAERYVEPLADTVLRLRTANNAAAAKSVTYESVSGSYADHEPYSGVVVKIKRNSKTPWHFSVVNRREATESAEQLFANYTLAYPDRHARVAWNGGYILNGELVGKLGLNSKYIGASLGLVIERGRMFSPPLFNKPALLIGKDGSLSIKRVDASGGFTLTAWKNVEEQIEFSADSHNQTRLLKKPQYYDLRYTHHTIPGNGRTICRLSGDVVREIIETKPNERVALLPTGLTLSFPAGQLPSWIQLDQPISFLFKKFAGIQHAIEAGPLFLQGGKNVLDMEKEGWNTPASIQTQAARTDDTHLRGPKIGAGLDKDGNLYIVAINGRIRESVGATHADMIRILREQGVVTAMGFDPGGSVSIVVDGKLLNIPPFNSNFIEQPLSAKPEARPIANVIIGWQ